MPVAAATALQGRSPPCRPFNCRNAVEAAEEVGANLQHVHCNTGHKWYGEATAPRNLRRQ